jgi:hypothetical protein
LERIRDGDEAEITSTYSIIYLLPLESKYVHRIDDDFMNDLLQISERSKSVCIIYL